MQVFGIVIVGNTLEEPRRCRVAASEHGSRLWIRSIVAVTTSPILYGYILLTSLYLQYVTQSPTSFVF